MKAKDPFKIVKVLLGLKATFLVAYLFVEAGIIKFDEAPLTAQDSNEASSSDGQTGDNSSSAVTEISGMNKIELPPIHEILSITPDDEKEAKKSISRYLDIIEKRHQEANMRINFLDQREVQLKNMEATLEKKLGELEEERLYILQTIQKEKKIKEERLTKLISLYEKMEPKKAAPVFENMDKDLAAALLKKLKQKQVTAILEKMTPEKALELTEYFGRIRSGAEYDILKEMNKSILETFKDCECSEPKGD